MCFVTKTLFDILAISDSNHEWILNLAKLCSIEPGDPFPEACLTKQWKIFPFLTFPSILQTSSDLCTSPNLFKKSIISCLSIKVEQVITPTPEIADKWLVCIQN